MLKPLVSIISINYNQAQVTCALLDSLRRITYPNIEIFVVDNASPMEEPTSIAERFPEVNLIRSPQNMGFSGGNNLGIIQAKGKYALFLNNDTEVDPNFLEPLVELLESNPAIGMVSPKIIFYGTDNIIQYAGSSAINPWTGRSVTIGNQERDYGQHDNTSMTQLVHGAAMMVPMDTIRKAGLMPEIYFLYYEEHDWCEMIKRANYKCYYVGGSTVYHKESMSVGQGSILRTYYMHRNRLLFIRRNTSGLQKLSGVLFFVFVAATKQSLVHIVKGEIKHLQALWKGICWHIKGENVHQSKFLSGNL
jgi:GT2 family glycosyltransferase